MTAATPPPVRASPSAQSSTTAAALALIGAGITLVSAFAIAILVASESDAAAGKFFVATAVVSILGTLTCFGNMTSMVYFMPDAIGGRDPNPRGLIRLGLRTVLMLSIPIGLLLALLADPLAAVVTETAVDRDQVADALRLISPAVPAWAVTLALLGATRGLGSHLPTVVTVQIFRPLAQVALLVAVVAQAGEAPTWQLVGAWGLPVIFGVALAVFWVHRLGGFVGSGPSEVSSTDLRHYNRRHGASTSLTIALERIDVVLVSSLLSPAAAGIYGTLTRLASAGNFLLFSVAQSVTPHLRRLIAANNLPEARRLFKQVTGWMVMIGWPYLLVLATKSEAVAALMKDSYREEGSLLIFLAFGIMFSAIAGPVESGVLMLGRASANLATTVASFLTDLVLLFVLVPPLGIDGAAIAWAAALIVKNASAGWLAFDGGRLLGFGRAAVVAAVGAVAAVVPVALLTGSSFESLLVVAAVALPILVAWMFLQRTTLGLDELVHRRA